ncbi:MAG: hypothetical protein LBQ83_05185 [Candidatus Margulisbacteria bacterium]|jgi:hypothetical protein|nr:hypothetical protein [Candidatus Margulisiibacteriota bacterium]
MAGNYTGEYSGIKTGEQLRAADMTSALNRMEKVEYKVTSLSAASTDTQYPSAKAVYGGLAAKQDKIAAGTANNIAAYSGTAGTLNTLTRVTSVQAAADALDTAIPTEKAVATALAAKANASAVASLNFFPKGTILMYDGTSWTDNVTLKGWYKCEGQPVDGYGTLPDLKNRFVIGYDAANTSLRTKDNNSIKLAENNLPGHTHDTHSGTAKLLEDNSEVQIGTVTGVFGASDHKSYAYAGTHGQRTITDEYTLTITAPHSVFGKKNADGTPSLNNDAFDNRPSYYALIYIIKVTNAGE